MNKIHHTLTFKIGMVIILAELIIFSLVGFVMVRRFSAEIDSRLEKQITLPGLIMNTNQSNLDIMSNREELENLVEAEVIDSLLVSPRSQIIVESLNAAEVGRKVTDRPQIDPAWFSTAVQENRLIWEENSLSAVLPVYIVNSDQVLFLAYVKASTASAQAQKAAVTRLFILSGAIIIGLTSLAITLSFQRLILNRVTAVLKVMRTAEQGYLSARIPLPISQDEIGLLQRGVNSLIGQLQQTVQDLVQRINELRLTENALRQSEEKYRDFVEGTDDLITQVDTNGNFIYVNHTAERIFGLSQEALIGRSAFDFIHPDDLERTRAAFQKWIQDHTTAATFENRQVHLDGEVFTMLWTINVYFDVYGSVAYLNSIARDISTRKQVEEQLQLQSTALEAAANGIVITDHRGHAIWVNPAFTRLTGYTLAETKGKNMNILNSGRQSKAFYKELWRTIRGGQVWHGELINRRQDGTLYNEEMTITPVWNEGGQISHYVAIKQDVTERKLVEKELRDRATSLELIAQVGRRTTAILALDELLHQAVHLISDTFDYYNVVIRLIEGEYVILKATSLHTLKPLEGQTRLKLGQGITGWVAKHGEPLLAPDVRVESRYHAELSSIETMSEVAVPIRLKEVIIGVLDTQSVHLNAFDEDDVFTLQAVAAQLAVAIENARLYDAAQQEILERRNAEEQLKIYTAELERSNRELQNFAYVSSHDLQEPLRKIQMFGDRLRDKYGDALDQHGQDYLDRMQGAAARMQALIMDLLAFSRVISRGEPFVWVDLNRVLAEVLTDLEVKIEQVHGRISYDPLPTLQADSTQMRQLFQNLLSNALKYHRPGRSPHIHISTSPLPDGHHEITVTDNGIGFEEKYVDRIFNVFQRLHGRTEYEGTGVGLAICKHIAERHNGRITARSTPNQGATFIVILPEKQSPAPAQPP